MQPSITLVELPPTSFGRIDGEKVKDIYAGFKLPSRANPLLHSILLREGYQDVRTIDPNYNSTPGRLSSGNFERIVGSDYLLLSAITRTVPQTRELALLYKKANPAGKVIVGGPHATFLPEESLQWADVVIRNEGDKTLPELIRKLEKDGSPDGVKGVSYKRNGEVVHEDFREPLTEEELSNLPQLFFEESVRNGRDYLTISTSRGCPYHCNFCAVRIIYGSKYRRRSNESILSELERLMGEPQRYVFFTDDNFAGKKKETKDLLWRMIDLGYDHKRYLVQLSIQSAFEPELLSLLKRTGVFAAFVGVESVNEETLKSLNKKTTAERNKEAVRLFREAGIWVHGMMIVGGDGDTKESLEETLAWTRGNLDSVQFFTPIPLPGTAFAREMEQQDRVLTRDYHLYDTQHVIIRPKNLTPYELQETIIAMNRKFYSLRNPVKMLRRSVRPLHKLVIDSYARGIIKSITSDSQTREHLERLKKC